MIDNKNAEYFKAKKAELETEAEEVIKTKALELFNKTKTLRAIETSMGGLWFYFTDGTSMESDELYSLIKTQKSIKDFIDYYKSIDEIFNTNPSYPYLCITLIEAEDRFMFPKEMPKEVSEIIVGKEIENYNKFYIIKEILSPNSFSADVYKIKYDTSIKTLVGTEVISKEILDYYIEKEWNDKRYNTPYKKE